MGHLGSTCFRSRWRYPSTRAETGVRRARGEGDEGPGGVKGDGDGGGDCTRDLMSTNIHVQPDLSTYVTRVAFLCRDALQCPVGQAARLWSSSTCVYVACDSSASSRRYRRAASSVLCVLPILSQLFQQHRLGPDRDPGSCSHARSSAEDTDVGVLCGAMLALVGRGLTLLPPIVPRRRTDSSCTLLVHETRRSRASTSHMGRAQSLRPRARQAIAKPLEAHGVVGRCCTTDHSNGAV